MTIVELLLLLLVAGVCGSIAQSLAGFSNTGCLGSIVLGFIGALLGSYLARAAGLPMFWDVQVGGRSFPVIWSIVGASLFSAVLAFISRGRIA